MKSSVPYAVAAILAGAACRAFAATPTTDPSQAQADTTGTGTATAPAAAATPDTTQLATIIVTAQRRTENMQDVPITIQALTARR